MRQGGDLATAALEVVGGVNGLPSMVTVKPASWNRLVGSCAQSTFAVQ